MRCWHVYIISSIFQAPVVLLGSSRGGWMGGTGLRGSQQKHTANRFNLVSLMPWPAGFVGYVILRVKVEDGRVLCTSS